MGLELYNASSAAREVFQEADDSLPERALVIFFFGSAPILGFL